MKTTPLFVVAALLFSASALAHAASPASAERPFLTLDSDLAELAAKLGDFGKCITAHAAHKAEFAHKKKQVAAEFGGTIPQSFDLLFELREARLSRSFLTCQGMNQRLPSLFEKASVGVKSFDPPSIPGLARRRERLASLQRLGSTLSKRL